MFRLSSLQRRGKNKQDLNTAFAHATAKVAIIPLPRGFRPQAGQWQEKPATASAPGGGRK
jgi:hypothetical protein